MRRATADPTLGRRRPIVTPAGVSWSDLDRDNDDLAVWPEEGIVPTRPRQTMREPTGEGCLEGTGRLCSTGGHHNIEIAAGIYRREFRDCDDRGVAFGRCAVIVNTTSRAITVKKRWLTSSYAHRITFVGGDVQTGGQLRARFSVTEGVGGVM
jgi:hypothetical protein